MRKLRLFWVLLLLNPLVYGSLPANQDRYSFPTVFEFQKDVLYGKKLIEVAVLVQPMADVQTGFLSFQLTHPKHLQLASNSELHAETLPLKALKKGQKERLIFRLDVTRDFTLAALKLNVSFRYPKEWALEKIAQSSEGSYPQAAARQDLIRRIQSLSTMSSETFGVYLNGRELKGNRATSK